jgi:hypothetical protein
MNTVNRVVVVGILVLAAIVCCVMLAGARWIIPALANQLDSLAQLVESVPWYQVVLPGVVLAFVVDFVLVLLIIFEVRPPKAKFIRVERAAGGEVELDVTSVVGRLKQEVDALPGVINVRPKVSAKRKGVEVQLKADIIEGADLPVQGERIADAVREVIEEVIGLKMTKPPKVSLRTVSQVKKAPVRSVEPKKSPPAEPKEKPPAFPEIPSYSLDRSDKDSSV